jgi:hypothetical protein
MAKLITTSPIIEAPDSEELAPVDMATEEVKPIVPDFAPYFDVNQPLPAPRSKEWKGYIIGLDEPVYRKFPALNQSTLKPITQAEILHGMQNPSSIDPEAAAIGHVIHWACLEQWRFADWQAHMILCRTKGLDTKKADEDRAANPGKLVVTPEIVDTAHRCLEAIQANPEAMALLNGQDPEDTLSKPSPITTEATGIVWDGKFGIMHKWRVDFLPQNLLYIGDVKSTREHPSNWRREAIKMKYVDQATYYTYCHFLLTGQWRDWCWIVVTKKAPFMCRVVRMRNLKKADPLYDVSLWKTSRERLGLDDSLRMGQIPKFINSARETLQLQQAVKNLTPAMLRQCWPAYESESPMFELLD